MTTAIAVTTRTSRLFSQSFMLIFLRSFVRKIRRLTFYALSE